MTIPGDLLHAAPRGPAAHVDHVGSLVRPPELMRAWTEHEQGKMQEPQFRQMMEEAIRGAVKLQEDLGLQVVTDGEFRRGGWSRGFLSAVEGFTFKPSYLTFKNEEGVSTPAPAPVATKKLQRTNGIVTEDFAFLKQVTKRIPKVTMPTPSHLHFGHFGEAMDRKIYPDPAKYWDDLVRIYQEEIDARAAQGCRFLQLDEVPLTLCCDETNRGIAKRQGEDPERLIDTYIEVINRAVSRRPRDMRIALHLCRGNMQGLWMGDGGYAPVAERMFGRLDVDAYLLEYDSPRAGDFAPLKHLPKGKMAFLGLVSTKRPELESIEDIQKKVDEAARHVALEQLGLCPQCGFGSSAMSKFNVLPNPMTEEMEKRKLARILEAAETVWK